MTTSSKVWRLFGWGAVLALAAFLRFDKLSDRPFHADEATGARITSQRIDPAAGYKFNPVHNHGPLLSAAAEPICRLRGETSWREMSKLGLRLVTAIAGTLLVLVPVLWRRRFGDVPMLAAAALLATSPVLVYFSRVFIHEMLLALTGLAAVVVICTGTRSSLTLRMGVAGLLVGLMFATKESFAISIIAWTSAGILLAFSRLREIKALNTTEGRKQLWQDCRKPLLAFVFAAGAGAGWFYTDGSTNPAGAWDAVRTFFVYKTVSGHDKPFLYYIEMMAVPTKRGIWWHEAPVLVFAVIALVRSFLPGTPRDTREHIVRFLAFSAILHVLGYSMIAYKTPWLMCLPWAHVCLLAGLGFRGFARWPVAVRIAAVFCLGAALFQQGRLSRFATGRFANDARNPHAYAPTSRDMESLRDWLQKLSAELPPSALEPVGVVGTEYWPLPWYLRDFNAIGYWTEPAPEIDNCPLVFAMPEYAGEVNARLEETHVALPRTLRSEVTVMLFLRKDHWEKWMAPASPEHPDTP